MGILEDSIGAMFGRGSGDSSGPSFGSAPYAKAATGGFGNLGSLFGGGQAPAQPQGGYGQAPAPQAGYSQTSEPQGGGGLLGGLGGLLHQFQQNGMGNVAQSWVGSGPNQPASPGQLSQALGPEVVQQIAQRTGMSEQQVLQQLAQELPSLVDKLTPQGRLPTHQEASSFLNGSNPLNPA
jgi:uncharacterized protein YidB (DUF937 family)